MADENTSPQQPLQSRPSPIESKAEAMAPRPHWITIFLGLISPMVAIAALAISLLSYHFSVDSVKTAQRAYLRADITIEKEANGKENIWDVIINARNTGNTPAYITEVDPHWD